jgi:hypothetical protein
VSHTLADLRAKPIAELIAEHDHLAKTTSVGVNYYLDELARRDAAAIATAIARNTEAVAAEVGRLFELSEASGKRAVRLTLVITVLTAVNVVAAIVAALAVL